MTPEELKQIEERANSAYETIKHNWEVSEWCEYALTDADDLILAVNALLAEVKRLQKELGAAKDDLERYTTCQVCGNTKCYKRNGRENCKWEWRGVKGE
jgi:hypothetical protein